jgi:hypothetical protein
MRVAGADNADEADDGDEAFVPGTTAEADGEDSDGYWWAWQSTEARAAKRVVPQWGNRVIKLRASPAKATMGGASSRWSGLGRRGLKEVGVNESRGKSGEQE